MPKPIYELCELIVVAFLLIYVHFEQAVVR